MFYSSNKTSEVHIGAPRLNHHHFDTFGIYKI